MKIETILEKLKSGEIKINDCGHCTNEIIDQIERNVKTLLESDLFDPKKTDVKPEHARLILGYDPEIGQKVTDSEIYCFDCGAHCRAYLISETEIALIDRVLVRETKGMNYIVDNGMQPEDATQCPMSDARNKGFHETFVNFPTGKVVFQNFFRKDEMTANSDKSKTYNPGINCILGRIDLADDLATRDVGYGQMGNMSVSVYLHKNCKSIIIGDEYYYDGDVEKRRNYDDYICIGSICLDVWRWQCADLQTIQKYDEDCEYTMQSEPTNPTKDKYGDVHLLHVVPGKWRIEHRFDFMTMDDEKDPDMYYSKLTLVEDEKQDTKKETNQSTIEMLCS